MPIGEIFLDVRLISLVAVVFFALAALYSSVGHGGASGYGNALISVHPSRQLLSRSVPEAELAVSEGVSRTLVFGLRTRRWMSAYGYKRTFLRTEN